MALGFLIGLFCEAEWSRKDNQIGKSILLKYPIFRIYTVNTFSSNVSILIKVLNAVDRDVDLTTNCVPHTYLFTVPLTLKKCLKFLLSTLSF